MKARLICLKIFLAIYAVQLCCWVRYAFWPLKSHSWKSSGYEIRLDVKLQSFDELSLFPIIGFLHFISQNGVEAQYRFGNSVLEKFYESEYDIPISNYSMYVADSRVGLRETDGAWSETVIDWELPSEAPTGETLSHFHKVK